MLNSIVFASRKASLAPLEQTQSLQAQNLREYSLIDFAIWRLYICAVIYALGHHRTAAAAPQPPTTCGAVLPLIHIQETRFILSRFIKSYLGQGVDRGDMAHRSIHFHLAASNAAAMIDDKIAVAGAARAGVRPCEVDAIKERGEKVIRRQICFDKLQNSAQALD